MKKLYLAAVCLTALLFLVSCDDEENDPPPFTNGLMVDFGDISYDIYGNWKDLASISEITARRNVSCTLTGDMNSPKVSFSAETADGRKWNMVFRYDMNARPDTVWIQSDYSTNKFELSSSDPAWAYYINNISGIDEKYTRKTFINVIQLRPDTIFEANFGGYFFKTGTTVNPDSLIGGYIHIDADREWIWN